MAHTILLVLLGLAALLASSLVAFTAYILIKYTPIIGGIFERTPLFFPTRRTPEPGGEEVRFPTEDGFELAGAYFPARTDRRAGVVVFCHEFLSDRWSFQPYADGLRDRGFDLFTFDFRNHGDSATESSYRPLQWVSDREVRDLRAALAYLRTRPDYDPAGVGLFGISRGGSTALCVAAEEPGVWGVVTDGAFPTRGMVMAFIFRWAEIYSSRVWKMVPVWVLEFLGWSGRVRSQWRRGCRFVDVEGAARRLSPRPWLMIHGAKDTYINPEVARGLFDEAGEPKEFWLVPGAKHNRCHEVEPDAYRGRLATFFDHFAPRRPTLVPTSEPEPTPVVEERLEVPEAAAPVSSKALAS